MHYAAIKKNDVANGNGIRVSLFVSGCRHRCPHCFNPETWDFAYGKPFTKETEDELLAALEKDYIEGLTLLGGDPTEPENQRALLPLLRRMKKAFPEKTVWCYSGYLLHELLSGGCAHTEDTDEFLSFLDILVDGPFIETEKDLRLRFRGSRNQRVIDVKKTRALGEIHIWDKLGDR